MVLVIVQYIYITLKTFKAVFIQMFSGLFILRTLKFVYACQNIYGDYFKHYHH